MTVRTLTSLALLAVSAVLFGCDVSQSSEPDGSAASAGTPPAVGGSASAGAPAAGGALSNSGGATLSNGGALASNGGASGNIGAAGAPSGSAGADPCAGAVTPTPAANGANFPFPQNRANHCALPTTLACLKTQNTQIAADYARWKTTFVTTTGAGGALRVQRDATDNNDTVSEGIGYGMLAAVYMADKATFDGLWSFAKAHFNGKGLMNWKITSSGSVAGDGQNGATDADEDMAWALVMADKQWGGTYLTDAKTLINAIYANEVEAGSFVLKPGDAFGGSDTLNPSYLAPSYYRVFGAVTNQAGWAQVVEKSYAILAAAANPQTGLVPDWCTASGSPASGHSANYTYDACRTPYRVALDYCENGEPRALAFASKVVGFFATSTPNAMKDGYTLSGSATGTVFGQMAFTAPMSVAATVDPKFATFAAQAQVSLSSKSLSQDKGTYSYFNASWGLIGMLTLSGNFGDLRSF
jgi:endo-1,4-beta-D-glucanase Y